jgi:hypothetical protein
MNRRRAGTLALALTLALPSACHDPPRPAEPAQEISMDDSLAAPASYVDEVLLTEAHREAFFALIDAEGLVVCRGVGGDDATHAEVRGRSSRGR